MTQKKILVADDEKDIVELVAFNLEREGFAVSRAYDGQQAWERVNTEKPDLVILDLMMPELSGMEVCGRIRRQEKTAALPIIMLTAKSDPVDKILGSGDRGGRLHHETLSCPGAHRPCPCRPASVGTNPRCGSQRTVRLPGASHRFHVLSGDRGRSTDRTEFARIQTSSVFRQPSRTRIQQGSASGPRLGGRGLRRAPDGGRPYQPPPGRDRTGQGESPIHPHHSRYRIQVRRYGCMNAGLLLPKFIIVFVNPKA